MCTAIAFGEKNRYFGRNLDYERGFGEQVVVTPRNFPLEYRFLPQQRKHYAFIGMASVMEGYPLYYEASNERGLSVAGLNFVGNCRFCNVTLDMHVNLCQFEIVPYIMAKCASVDEAKAVLKRINLVGERFLPDLPLAELHWMLCDSEQCAVLEITREGACFYDNPVGVLTNNPPFPYQVQNLNNFQSLSSGDPVARFGGEGARFDVYSRGMGAIGLPGDWSSASRFVRAAFVRANAEHVTGESGASSDTERAEIEQFFHILGSVEMVKGCVRVGEKHEFTRYSCCFDRLRGAYYFKTYSDMRTRKVLLPSKNIDGDELYGIEPSACEKL